MPSYNFDDGLVRTSYTSALGEAVSQISYSTLLTSASYAWPGFDALQDMDTGLFNERDWMEWEDWHLKWGETDPSMIGSQLPWSEWD
jgi:hypothetical protein